MKRIVLGLLTIFVCSISNGQQQLNHQLKEQLDTILHKDQTLRELFDNSIKPERKEEILTEFGYTQEDFKTRFWGIVAEQDSLNLLDIENIILKYGYPGKSLVGEPTNEAAWYVIQHSSKIEKYFAKIQKAGDTNELPKRLVAMMHDRLLSEQGKAQIYGTQIAGRKINSKNNREEQWFNFVWPIKNPEKVNALRKELGFELTVEENAKRLDVEYQVYTLKEIDSILNPQ